jgi:hypothetical protein
MLVTMLSFLTSVTSSPLLFQLAMVLSPLMSKICVRKPCCHHLKLWVREGSITHIERKIRECHLRLTIQILKTFSS